MDMSGMLVGMVLVIAVLVRLVALVPAVLVARSFCLEVHRLLH